MYEKHDRTREKTTHVGTQVGAEKYHYPTQKH
jgi:hypothetical protein